MTKPQFSILPIFTCDPDSGYTDDITIFGKGSSTYISSDSSSPVIFLNSDTIMDHDIIIVHSGKFLFDAEACPYEVYTRQEIEDISNKGEILHDKYTILLDESLWLASHRHEFRRLLIDNDVYGICSFYHNRNFKHNIDNMTIHEYKSPSLYNVVANHLQLEPVDPYKILITHGKPTSSFVLEDSRYLNAIVCKLLYDYPMEEFTIYTLVEDPN